jgi:hypothetical protein
LPNAVVDTTIGESGSIVTEFWSKEQPGSVITVEVTDGQTTVDSNIKPLDNVFHHLESIWHDGQLRELRNDMPKVTITDHLQRAERKYKRDQRKVEFKRQIKDQYSQLKEFEQAGNALEEPIEHQALRILIWNRTPSIASSQHHRLVFHAIVGVATDAQIEDDDLMGSIIKDLFNKAYRYLRQ